MPNNWDLVPALVNLSCQQFIVATATFSPPSMN
jgi:hypothetical protein